MPPLLPTAINYYINTFKPFPPCSLPLYVQPPDLRKARALGRPRRKDLSTLTEEEHSAEVARLEAGRQRSQKYRERQGVADKAHTVSLRLQRYFYHIMTHG